MNIFKKIAGLDKLSRDPEEAELYDETENETGVEEVEEEAETEEESEQEEESSTEPKEEVWLADQEEGQLSIDVYQTPEHLVVKSTIAGVKPEDIDISINNDMLTIRGRREMNETVRDQDYLYRECYWGSFSRSIILPIEIKAEKIEAFLENGVLTVMLPKAKTSKQISIKVKER
jgi:HSP20 family protein